ncbi:MAG: hypothetical protein HQL69_08355 [Magnetococcales bacterium]|nr:hypothetical protein [Magnetococcales bacterium]
MTSDIIAIYGLHGESLSCPSDTITSYWAAMGAGGDGFVAALQITSDDTMVCCPTGVLDYHSSEQFIVADHTAAELREQDAGKSFYSTVLDEDNQPTGEYGEDKPWVGNPKKNDHLYFPKLSEVLQLFGRRTKIFLLFPKVEKPSVVNTMADQTMADLKKYGLNTRVTVVAQKSVCDRFQDYSPSTPLALIADSSLTYTQNMQLAKDTGATLSYINVEDLDVSEAQHSEFNDIKLLLTSKKHPYAPTLDQFRHIKSLDNLAGLCFMGVEQCVNLETPPAQVLHDDFSAPKIDNQIWSAGYSHANTNTTIKLEDNHFVLDIISGGVYSGGAVVTVLPIHGRFDARVDFVVDHPHQGTTFEMAAISQDPGYFHIDNSDLGSTNVNLTFDVHGAPPYASSERDEDDGFRIGWNNGFNLTKVDEDWNSSSVNMYNKYGRDVGYGPGDSPTGTLRLLRNGPVFNSYYKDKFNKAWVCSGSVLVANLGPDIHIRLAGKHWPKYGDEAPGNRIAFTNFHLLQF